MTDQGTPAAAAPSNGHPGTLPPWAACSWCQTEDNLVRTAHTIFFCKACADLFREVAKDQLRAIIERIERCEEEKKDIADDIRDIYAEAKGNGFDVKALRTIIRMRKQDVNERAEQESILETYMQALGML